MTRLRARLPVMFAALFVLCACATRPINPPITQADPGVGYRFETRQLYFKDPEALVLLAFSGGGTRAAAFSYGVLEFLRRTEVDRANGEKVRLLDAVGVITGVSGGSFTALAYGLYGDKLFADYEQRFLKRNVQGEIISRLFNPARWGNLWWTRWGRSEMAADLYDEILFNGATFADLERGKGPLVLASATDLSTGARLVFDQNVFDALCSDLGAVKLSRAAAASSAVPVVLSAVTLNNYGGTCNYQTPSWLQFLSGAADPPRTAARARRDFDERLAFADGAQRPYIHLVDGGVADNVGMRSVLTLLELMEALQGAGVPTPFDRTRRIVVFVVNSVSSPPTRWDQSETPPGTISTLLQASSVPIDHYSYEATELLRDKAARWQSLRRLRQSAAFADHQDAAIADDLKGPEVEIYAIDVSFAALQDKAEFAYLNGLPTSFVLPAEAVDRLRTAAGAIIMASPEFQRLLKDVGAKVAPESASMEPATSAAPVALPTAAPGAR
ncbi:MAG: patatin-like phospholipase family protein [Candidatus Accumulibacter sp.]|uniref:Patatin-like phospholipase family protein n=1 Tax=Candidatus Accumulibacter affinis TaxID=2954384 RepID=A0A935T7V1_9PROT|nr:patatin-like phospholipase family protein [Candidatus Accumulibacter affinis]